MIVAFRSTFFIVIGMHVLLMKLRPQPNPRIGLFADGFAPRSRDGVRSGRKCSSSWFGVIRMTTKQAKRSLVNLVRSFAPVDRFDCRENILKSQQEAGGFLVRT